MNLEQITTKAMEMVMEYGPKLLLAIIALFVGLRLVKLLDRLVEKLLKKRDVSADLQPFLRGIISTLFKALVVISVLAMVGVEMTSFIVILGAISLAIGMALSGTLQNFAGGVIILIFKPFKVGDYIEAQGYSGTVNEIQIFNTILKTPDNRTIIIPNSPLSTGAMVNYSVEAQRRVDFSFGIGYSDDIDKARKILLGLIKEDTRILNDPEPFIAIAELADSSVNFVVRVWVKATDYWGVHFDMIEKVKKAFDKEGVSIPFPQQDVHLHQVG